MKRSMPTNTGVPRKPATKEAPAARVQMVDVARLAGVSSATVSRALSGHSSIPEVTRLRIAEIAKSIGYRVNHSAANLRKGSNSTVGVVVLADDEQPISDPFILGMVGHIADALNQRGQSLLLTRLQKDHMAAMYALIDTGQVGGMLVIGQANYHQQLKEMEDNGVPIVVWGAVLPDANYSVVGGDNLQGGYLATRHLLDRGARHIAFLGDIRYPEVRLRHDGYRQALKEFGLKPEKKLFSTYLYSAKEVDKVVADWISSGVAFDAVFATSDVAAANVISALGTRNVKVPHQVRVVGYDDVPLSAYLHPTLTTVNQPINLAAAAMVDLLKEKMAGGTSRAVVLPAHLVERKSTR